MGGLLFFDINNPTTCINPVNIPLQQRCINPNPPTNVNCTNLNINSPLECFVSCPPIACQCYLNDTCENNFVITTNSTANCRLTKDLSVDIRCPSGFFGCEIANLTTLSPQNCFVDCVRFGCEPCFLFNFCSLTA